MPRNKSKLNRYYYFLSYRTQHTSWCNICRDHQGARTQTSQFGPTWIRYGALTCPRWGPSGTILQIQYSKYNLLVEFNEGLILENCVFIHRSSDTFVTSIHQNIRSLRFFCTNLFFAWSTGKSLSEALLFCRTWGEHVVYKNCSECQKQFLYTTCSPQVWAWNFHVIQWTICLHIVG